MMGPWMIDTCKSVHVHIHMQEDALVLVRVSSRIPAQYRILDNFSPFFEGCDLRWCQFKSAQVQSSPEGGQRNTTTTKLVVVTHELKNSNTLFANLRVGWMGRCTCVCACRYEQKDLWCSSKVWLLPTQTLFMLKGYFLSKLTLVFILMRTSSALKLVWGVSLLLIYMYNIVGQLTQCHNIQLCTLNNIIKLGRASYYGS